MPYLSQIFGKSRFAILEFNAALMLLLSGCGSPNESTGGRVGLQAGISSTLDAQTILQAAIEAHGGRADFQNLNAGEIRLSTRGIVSDQVQDLIVTTETYQSSDHLRRETLHETAGDTRRRTYLRCGSDAWEAVDDGDYKRAENLEDTRFLFPFQKLNELRMASESGFELVRLSDEQIEDVPVHVLQFKQAGQTLAEVSFDASTHLVRRVKKSDLNPWTGMPGESITHSTEYQKFHGLAVPGSTKTYIDGKLLVEIKLVDFVPLEYVPFERFKPPSGTTPR